MNLENGIGFIAQINRMIKLQAFIVMMYHIVPYLPNS